jgi:hypothetical protein
MSEPLTDDELQAAKALVDAATPGPWSALPDEGMIESCVAKIIWPRNAMNPQMGYRYAEAARIGACGTHAELHAADNLRFIAASRTLVPRLLAEIDRLRARQQELLATIVRVTNETPYPDEVRGWESQRAAMVAEIGTLRAQLRARELTDDERQTLRGIRTHVVAYVGVDTPDVAVLDKLLGGGGK